MKLPIELKLDDKQVATITSYSYETPWASGSVEFIKEALFDKLVGITTMLFYDLEVDELGLEDDEEEKFWETQLTELNLTCDDLSLNRDHKWSITDTNHESHLIYATRFFRNGYVDWRF